MEKFEESQTKKNLEESLKGESLAHLKYQFYKSKLSEINKKYESILEEIIHNEKEHGKIWFKKLNGGEIPNNEINLIDAIEGETYEAEIMYREFGDIAKEEGFLDIAELFYKIAEIEGNHAKKFKEIKEELKLDLFESNDICKWKCLNCGHIIEEYSAPLECPVCNHPQKYFIKME